MPIEYDTNAQKWIIHLTPEENIQLSKLVKYLQDKIDTKAVFVDKNHKVNTLIDLRIYNDEDFFNS